MLLFDTVVQTQFGSFFKAFALPTDPKPATGVCPGSRIEEFNPTTGVVDIYRFSGEAWVKVDASGTPVVPPELPEIEEGDTGKVLTVGSSGVEWDSLPAPELPEIEEGDTGKVLTVGSDGAEWAAVPDELPPLPSVVGTYTLQLVIAEGEDPVLSWEAEEEL